MKKSLFIAALALLAAACTNDPDAHRFSNVVYFNASSAVAEVRVAEDDATLTRSVSVQMALPETAKAVKVALAVDEGKLETYRKMYVDSQAQLLPAANYSLSANEFNMAEGFVSSEKITVTFKNANLLPDLKTHYVLPLTVSSADVDVLGSGSTLYYVLSKASLVNVVADLYDNRCWPYFDDDPTFKDMTSFTLEALVNATTFKRVDHKGSKIASPLATVMGVEDRFLIRVGDTGIPDDQLQIAYALKDDEGTTHRNHVSTAAMKLKAGQWYHLAVTFDHGKINVYMNGNLMASDDASVNGVNKVDFSTPHSEEDGGKPRCFWVGYSYDQERYWNGRICECRIWNKALTEADINADKHFYQVDPASDGLVAYWKFDDGEGSTVKDHAGSHDLTSQLPISWYPVALPEE